MLVLASCGDGSGTGTPPGPTEPTGTMTSAATSATSLATTEPTTTEPATPTTTSRTTDPATTSSDASPAPTLAPTLGDVAYATMSPLQRLDVYTPADGAAPYPVVVIIHGGGWTVGDKRGELPLSAIPGFLGLGYAVASVNYRLAPDAAFPAQLLDVKAAVRYLRANAALLQLDPDRFAAVGESAGAHLAALLGTTSGVAAFDDPQLGNPGVSSAVSAVVDFYGPANLGSSDGQRRENAPCPSEPDPNIGLLLGAPPSEAPDLAAAASPVTYVGPDTELPPFFIAHGDADCVVPYQQSQELHDAIEAVAPGRSQLTIVPGSGHYLDFDFSQTNETVVAFLDETIGRPR